MAFTCSLNPERIPTKKLESVSSPVVVLAECSFGLSVTTSSTALSKKSRICFGTTASSRSVICRRLLLLLFFFIFFSRKLVRQSAWEMRCEISEASIMKMKSVVYLTINRLCRLRNGSRKYAGSYLLLRICAYFLEKMSFVRLSIVTWNEIIYIDVTTNVLWESLVCFFHFNYLRKWLLKTIEYVHYLCGVMT